MTNQKFDDLLFGVRRSVRYHSRRQAFNDLLRAMGYADEKEKVAVTWWQRQTAHFFNFGTHRLAKGG